MVLGAEESWLAGQEGEGARLRNPPLNELLHHLHPRVELVQGEDVLLSEQPQSRALAEVLQREQRAGAGETGRQEARGWWEPALPRDTGVEGNGDMPATSS